MTAFGLSGALNVIFATDPLSISPVTLTLTFGEFPTI